MYEHVAFARALEVANLTQAIHRQVDVYTIVNSGKITTDVSLRM